MPYSFGRQLQTGVTCGIELETDCFPQDFFSSKLPNNWRVTHDASIESDTKIILPFLTLSPEKQDSFLFTTQRTVVGAELVSPVLDSDDSTFLEEIDKVCNVLISYGESEESFRSGIHFHITFPSPSLKTLKNILKLGLHFESLFFHIGGMGYNHRGEKNQSIYARPISRTGPPAVPIRTGYAQVFNISDVLESKTLQEFWLKMGDLPGKDTRYTPIRYMSFNLYPLYQGREHRGTLEFRMFNKTLVPEYIWSAFWLCRSFTQVCLKASLMNLGELEENSVFDLDVNDFDLLAELAFLGNLPTFSLNILGQILERTPKPKFSNKYVFTHLLDRMDGYFWNESVYIPTRIEGEIINSGFVDIHTLRGGRR
jgi:hypothetical protein